MSIHRCRECGHDPYEPEAVLRWECETCGWTCDVPMPGFAGDGYRHYSGVPQRGCGPLVARRLEGFVRAHPGATTAEVAKAVAAASSEATR